MCDPNLQDAFHTACREAGLIGRAGDWNRELLKLRKAGELKKVLGKKKLKEIELADDQADTASMAGEIAWAEMQRKFPEWSLDALFCSPGKAFLFDRTASKYLDERLPAGPIRWQALRLRKAQSRLTEEAKQFDYVFRTRDFNRYQAWSRFRPDRFDGQAGLYLLRNKSRDPLYVGETADLGRRLALHAEAKAPGRAIAQAVCHHRRPTPQRRLPPAAVVGPVASLRAEAECFGVAAAAASPTTAAGSGPWR